MSRADLSQLFVFPEIPPLPGLEAEHVTLRWGLGSGICVCVLLFTVTVIEEGEAEGR